MDFFALMPHYCIHPALVIEKIDRKPIHTQTFLLFFAYLASPIEPQNVTVDDIDQASVKISWKQANHNGNDHVYRIECHRLIEGRSVPCESYITYQPNRTLINGTRFVSKQNKSSTEKK